VKLSCAAPPGHICGIAGADDRGCGGYCDCYEEPCVMPSCKAPPGYTCTIAGTDDRGCGGFCDCNPESEFVGYNAINRERRDTGSGMQFISEYTFSSDGILTMWELFSFRTTSMILQVWRESSSLTFDLVGYQTVDVSVGFNQFEASIKVQRGDVIGWYGVGVQPIEFDNGGDIVRRVYGFDGLTSPVSMTGHLNGWSRSYSIRAKVSQTRRRLDIAEQLSQTEVSRDESSDNRKCGSPDSTDYRVFDLRSGEATLEGCTNACIRDPSCVAFSGVFDSWCIGCSVPLDVSHEGAVAYKRNEESTPEYIKHGKSQCRADAAPYDGDRLDNPIFGGGGFIGQMTGAECEAQCNDPSNVDEHGRECVAFEHSSQNYDAVANCALAWACDFTKSWSGGTTYIRANTMLHTDRYNFQLRGDKGNEIVTITDGQETRTRQLSTSWKTFSASNANIVIRFKNDNIKGTYNVFLRSNTPTDIRIDPDDERFAEWKCGTSSENHRCELVRNGGFYWTADYQIEFKEATFWETCRWQSTRDQYLSDTQDLIGWTCADNEILTGFGINANEDDVSKIQCCELGGHSSVIPDTCTFIGVDDPEFQPGSASCNANDHMVFSGAYDASIGAGDDYTELLVGKCCEVRCDAPWCQNGDWGVNTDQCYTISADPYSYDAQDLVCPEGTLVTQVHDGHSGAAHGIQRVESVVCCELDVIPQPTKAPTTSPSPSPTTAPSSSPTTAPSPAPTSTSDCLLALFQCDSPLSDAEILQGIDDCLPDCMMPPHYYYRRALEGRLLENAE